jgi:hypothetical protein
METTNQLADKTGVSHDFFNRCRGIMGTENYGQDAALAQVISEVLAEARPRDFAFSAVTVEDPPEKMLMVELRALAEDVRHFVNRVQHFVEDRSREPLPEGHAPHSQVTHPGRWAALAQTELQSGFMKLVRAVAQPTTF